MYYLLRPLLSLLLTRAIPVLCREGKAVALSEDHKPDSPIEEARVKKAGGVISMGRVNGGLNLTRSLGDFDYKKSKNLDYS